MSQTNGNNFGVRLRNITRTFGSGARTIAALRGVDLEIEPGQLVVLAGPSGCGKTTLLSVMTGMLSPTSGEIDVFGINWYDYKQDRRAQLRGQIVGYVFQRFHLVPTLPVVYNVSLPLLARGQSHKVALARSAEVLREVGLGDRLDAKPLELSGGMQQRVAVARALVGQPRLLVCDEPTANLDSETGREVMQLIHAASREVDANGQKRVVVVVTHDIQAMRYADCIHRMADGKVTGASEEMLARVRRMVAAEAGPETLGA